MWSLNHLLEPKATSEYTRLAEHESPCVFEGLYWCKLVIRKKNLAPLPLSHGCWMFARFEMVESLGLVVILGILALAQAYSWAEIPLILALFITMPLLMLVFIRCRHAKTERIELHLFFCQTQVLSLIQQITSNFRLITDYWQQPAMVKAFGGKVQATNKAAMAALIRKIENGELLGKKRHSSWICLLVFHFFARLLGVSKVRLALTVWHIL